MSKFIPGPWKTGICQVTKEFLKGRLTEAVVTDDEVVICITGEGSSEANLISAAPDLYWALDALLTYGPGEKTRADAKAAIAKANGEAQ